MSGDNYNENGESDEEIINSEFIIKCEDLIKEITINYKSQRDQIRNLIKLHKKELKNAKKNKSNNKPKAKTGFTKPSKVPDKIANFIGIEKGTLMPRTKVTSLLIEEFKKRNLLYHKDKRIIIVNGDIRKLFPKLPESKIQSTDPKDQNGLNLYNLQTYITYAYDDTEDDNDDSLKI